MRKICLLSFIVCLLFAHSALTQTPFTATWSFEGNSGGSSSNGFVAASAVTYHNVNLFGPNPYTTGFVNLGANVQNWSTSLCNQTEYIEFTVQPLGTARITISSLTFAFARSANGPQQLSVRTSVDNFSSDIYAQSVGTTYQTASITLAGPGYIDQANPITFRIYACNPTSGGATLHIDEIQLNALALPVTLLSFTATPEADRVQLAWSTTSEIDAEWFVVERSYESGEYVFIGEVAGNGTTYERQYYGLTDLNPRLGTNYYRLKQIDRNGAVHTYKPISAIVRASEPVVNVYPNPARPDRIHLRLWNADDATVQLRAMTGQTVNGRLERQLSEADLVVDQPLPAGLYFLEVTRHGQKRTINVLIQ